MAVVFAHVFRVSLFVTPAILVLLFLTPHLARKYSARLRCFVWMLVIARLLIPIQFSLRGLFRDASPVTNLLERIDQNAVATALSQIFNEGGAVDSVTGQAASHVAIDWRVLGIVWLVGAVLFLSCNLIVYRMTMKRLQRWSVPVSDPFFQKVF
jgi:beta-lactamase regulating signal transducer with metallopeptidase domain